MDFSYFFNSRNRDTIAIILSFLQVKDLHKLRVVNKILLTMISKYFEDNFNLIYDDLVGSLRRRITWITPRIIYYRQSAITYNDIEVLSFWINRYAATLNLIYISNGQNMIGNCDNLKFKPDNPLINLKYLIMPKKLSNFVSELASRVSARHPPITINNFDL